MPLLNMHVHFFPHSEFSVPENPHFQFITILIDFQQKALIYLAFFLNFDIFKH